MKTQALVNESVGAPFILQDAELEEPQPNGELPSFSLVSFFPADLFSRSSAVS